ncbi:MAG: serine/threonine-protein kinase [Byssovorax sp.]
MPEQPSRFQNESPAEADPLTGTAYRAIAPLGRGAMGEVVEAEHIALGKRVVVKLLHGRLLDRDDQRERLRLEGQALAHLRHPNLVSVTDFQISAAGRPFLVMDRLEGRTLRDELRARGMLPVAEAVDLTRQALAGLAAVHAAGLVHRDIKPDNLFLCDPERSGAPRVLKLLDFGLAKVVSEGELPVRSLARVRTDRDVTVGTPRYYAPEQASGGAVDARTDLYAVGLVLYALLAGEGPFDHHKAYADVVMACIHEIPRKVSERARQPIPPRLDEVLAQVLEKRPEDRFPSAVDFSEALVMSLRPAPRWASTEPLAPITPRSPSSRDPFGGDPFEGDDAEPSISEDPTRPLRR